MTRVKIDNYNDVTLKLTVRQISEGGSKSFSDILLGAGAPSQIEGRGLRNFEIQGTPFLVSGHLKNLGGSNPCSSSDLQLNQIREGFPKFLRYYYNSPVLFRD